MRFKLVVGAIFFLMVGCAQYNGGREMPLSIFHGKFSKLTSAKYLSPSETEILLSEGACNVVAHHRFAALQGNFIGGDLRNAAKEVDSRVIYLDKADSYSIDHFRWVDVITGTELNLQIKSIDCSGLFAAKEVMPRFDISFNEEMYEKGKKGLIKKKAKEKAWNEYWSEKSSRRKASQPATQSTKKSSFPKLNGPHLIGQDGIVGGSMCKYSDGTVVKISGMYCPRRN